MIIKKDGEEPGMLLTPLIPALGQGGQRNPVSKSQKRNGGGAMGNFWVSDVVREVIISSFRAPYIRF